MKKSISLIFAAIFTVSLCANTVLAADPSVEITTKNLDQSNGDVIVKGKVSWKRGNLPAVLIVTDEGGNVVFGDETTTTAIKNDENLEDDNTFEFNSFRFVDAIGGEGTYTFTVHVNPIGVSESFQIGYIPNESWYNIIKTVKTNGAAYTLAPEANKASIADTNAAYITEKLIYTELNETKYNGLSTGARRLIAKVTMNEAYDIPEIWADTVENVALLTTAIDKFKAACAEGMIFAELYDSYKTGDIASSKAAFDTWFAANKTVLTLETDNAETSSLNEATFMAGAGNVFASSYNFESFYNKLPAIAEKLNSAEIQKGIVDAVILSRVDEITSGITLGSFLQPYITYIGINYGTANANQKGIAHGAVAGKTYNTLDALALAIQNNIPSGTGQGDNGDKGIYGGSTSTGNTQSVVTGVVNSGDATPVSSDYAPFTDLEGYDWAKDAIDFLYRRSIISGRNENTYDPSGAVTRAEFIKMLAITYNIDPENYQDAKFTDIIGSEWYSIFVKKAAIAGIVTGDENGQFNPNAQITREDMAVMVYRASKFPDATEDLMFTDSVDISGYAVKAVASLYENAVVSGVGNMVFAPKKNVTRAEAAQILYNVLEVTKK